MNREHLPMLCPVECHSSDHPLPDHRCNGIRDTHTGSILLTLRWFIQLLYDLLNSEINAFILMKSFL